jgi:hypothetical protein
MACTLALLHGTRSVLKAVLARFILRTLRK